MYILYGGGFTRAQMCEMVLAEVSAPYELREVDIMKGEHHAPEYLKINPAGWIPALVTPEGQTLSETPAINLYLAERHCLGALAPAPDDPDRGLFLSGLFYLTGELEPALKRYFYPHRFGARQGDAAEIRKMALVAISTVLQVVDQRLAAKGPYHLGSRYSLVDLVLSYWIQSIMDRGAVEPFGAVHRCVSLVEARPAISRLFVDLKSRTAAYAELEQSGDGKP